MREMSLDMMQLVVSVRRTLRRQLEIAAAERGATISDVVRDALEDAVGHIPLSDADRRRIARDMQAAHQTRLAIRHDRAAGVKRPNGRPPGTQLPGGRRKRPAPEASRQGTEDAARNRKRR